jgi:hypothetical protein
MCINFGNNLSRYYIWPVGCAPKPLVLLTLSQFQSLIDEVNRTFEDLYIRIDQWFYNIGFIMQSFPDHPRYHPRFLGRSTTKDDYQNLVDKAPPATYCSPNDSVKKMPNDRSLKAFTEMMERAHNTTKARKRSTAVKKRQNHTTQLSNISNTIKRVECYLGLRGKEDENGKNHY